MRPIFWLCAVLTVPSVSVAGPILYWADGANDVAEPTGRIVRYDTNTATLTALYGGLGRVTGLAIDSARQQVYWADTTTDAIYVAALDGSGVPQPLIQIAPASPRASEGYGITVDPVGGKVYWNDQLNRHVKRANLDGSRIETLAVAAADEYLLDVDLDLDHGYAYVSSSGPQGHIQRLGLSGSGGLSRIASQGVQTPGGIVVDPTAGYIYWTNVFSIERANLDGTGRTSLYADASMAFPWGIDIDREAGKLYWGEANGDVVRRINLDGTQPEVVWSGPADIFGLVVTQIPEPSLGAIWAVALSVRLKRSRPKCDPVRRS